MGENEKAVPDRTTGWMWAEKKRKVEGKSEIPSVPEWGNDSIISINIKIWRRDWFGSRGESYVWF